MRAILMTVLAACWSSTPVPAPPIAPAIATGPRGLVAILIGPEDATRAPYLSWHDLASGESGDVDYEQLEQFRPISAIAGHAAWLSHLSTVIRISRPAGGAGVVITPIANVSRLDGVSPDGSRFVRCGGDPTVCRTGPLADAAGDERPVSSPSLPQHDNIGVQKWLRDGRIAIREDGDFAIWFVDPNTGATTTSRLANQFTDVSDDGSLIVWTEFGDDKHVIQWRYLAEARVRSLDLAAAIASCGFTRHSLIYCDAQQTDGGVLLVIEPATGRSRVLARDVASHGNRIQPSPDGRYLAYSSTGKPGERTKIVDVVTGTTTSIGPTGKTSYPLAWLAPR